MNALNHDVRRDIDDAHHPGGGQLDPVAGGLPMHGAIFPHQSARGPRGPLVLGAPRPLVFSSAQRAARYAAVGDG